MRKYRVGHGAHDRALQNRILDLVEQEVPDREIARCERVGHTTVRELRNLNGITATQRRVVPVTNPRNVATEQDVLVERLMGLSIGAVAHKIGTTEAYVKAHTGKFMRFSGVHPHTNRAGFVKTKKNCLPPITRDRVTRLADDVRMCSWRCSDEMRQYHHNLPKWRFSQRICRAA